MTLEKIFKFDRINNEQYYAEGITFLSIFKLNLFINKKRVDISLLDSELDHLRQN